MNDGPIDERANELEEQVIKAEEEVHEMAARLAAIEATLVKHLARCPGSTDEDRAAAV